MSMEKRNESFFKTIEKRSNQKIKAQRNKGPNLLRGLGLFGMVGWSVVVPTLLGIACGVWIDKNYKSSYSWTLMLLIGGLILGSMIAWHWVEKERQDIHRINEDKKDEGKKGNK